MNTPLPDFEVLVALYQHDPEALEDFRRHILREAVDYAPLQHRASLEQLLVRIEAARTATTSPMEAAVAAFSMMQESTERLHRGWQRALHAVAGLQAAVLIEQARAASSITVGQGR